jgi:tetratricopeptide (TPR) repeat protein
MFWPASNGGITQLIQSAERLMAASNYKMALEQLLVAQNLEPRNDYIKAIIDRVQFLQEAGRSKNTQLATTVRPAFASGAQEFPSDQALSAKDLRVRIKQLTNIAEKYLEEGASDKAFDSLMKAFLLDPISPYVMACEKAVLPVWEKTHISNRTARATLNTRKDTNAMSSKKPSGFDFPGKPQSPMPEPLKTKLEQEQRLNMLRQQKESERQEKEHARWREASGPPKSLRTNEQKQTPKISPKNKPPEEEHGLFAKLKRGKFLG